MVNKIEMYCARNAITSNWYDCLKNIKNILNEIEVKRVFNKEDFKKIEDKVLTLCKYSNAIFEQEHLPDWLEYYVEIELSILYYLLEETKDNLNVDRVLQAQKEMIFNENTALDSMDK